MASVTFGSRLGVYEIIGAFGGGLGTVYHTCLLVGLDGWFFGVFGSRLFSDCSVASFCPKRLSSIFVELRRF